MPGEDALHGLNAVHAIHPEAVTAVILAGGRGSRMGGVDKGLQTFNGVALGLHTLLRLAPQVGQVIINANRNLETYKTFGVPVWPDDPALGDYPGPLAGFMTGLDHCRTPYLLTVPCDTPLFPKDLVARMTNGLEVAGADIAIATAPEGDSAEPRLQPVFCLMRANLLDDLRTFTTNGRRKVGEWAARHKVAHVPFDRATDDRQAFFNANTLAELHQLEARLP